MKKIQISYSAVNSHELNQEIRKLVLKCMSNPNFKVTQHNDTLYITTQRQVIDSITLDHMLK